MPAHNTITFYVPSCEPRGTHLSDNLSVGRCVPERGVRSRAVSRYRHAVRRTAPTCATRSRASHTATRPSAARPATPAADTMRHQAANVPTTTASRSMTSSCMRRAAAEACWRCCPTA
eukprot:6236530-Prymnesium_polylepis.1